VFLLLFALLQDDPKATYDAFEKKLTDAKSLRLTWKVEAAIVAAGEKDAIELEGELSMRRDDRARFFAKGKYLGTDFAGASVCDGKTLRVKMADAPADDRKCPEKLTKGLSQLIARAGLYAVVASGKPKLGLDEGWALSDFRKLDEEKDAKVIRFTVESGVKKEQFVAKVWFHAKTGLAAKRVVRGGDDKIEITITETWSEVVLDAEMPDEEFEFEK
jgi:hypothetical protein